MTDMDVIQGAVLAALGHVKPDYRSAKRLDDAAKVIAEFVVAAMVRDRLDNCKHPRKIGTGMVSSDGSSKSTWHCPDCGLSGGWETPARAQAPVALW